METDIQKEAEQALNNRVKYLLERWDERIEMATGKTRGIEEALEVSATLLACIRVMIGEQQKQIDQLNKKWNEKIPK